LSEQIRQAVDDYLKAANKKPGEFLFTGHRGAERSMTTRQYARLVSQWIGSVGLDPRLFGTHSLRRTKAALIYRRTGNLRAVQLLLGHTKKAPSDIWASRTNQSRPGRAGGRSGVSAVPRSRSIFPVQPDIAMCQQPIFDVHWRTMYLWSIEYRAV
jgi:hypothetical protein